MPDLMPVPNVALSIRDFMREKADGQMRGAQTKDFYFKDNQASAATTT
jgi:hypothetical protein